MAEAAEQKAAAEEPGKDNAHRILGRRRPLQVTIRLLDPLSPMRDRKALSEAARDAIGEALASSQRATRL